MIRYVFIVNAFRSISWRAEHFLEKKKIFVSMHDDEQTSVQTLTRKSLQIDQMNVVD